VRTAKWATGSIQTKFFYLKGTSFIKVVKETGLDSPEHQSVGHAILVFIPL